MRNGIFGICLLAVVLVVFWVWDGSKVPPPTAIQGKPDPKPVPVEPAAPIERYTSGTLIETIDLSHAFEPTGDELTLRLLLEANQPEELPPPRGAEPELAPLPRIAKSKFAAAGEEMSSPVDRLAQLISVVQFYVAERGMEMMLSAQPLKGTGDH